MMVLNDYKTVAKKIAGTHDMVHSKHESMHGIPADKAKLPTVKLPK